MSETGPESPGIKRGPYEILGGRCGHQGKNKSSNVRGKPEEEAEADQMTLDAKSRGGKRKGREADPNQAVVEWGQTKMF